MPSRPPGFPAHGTIAMREGDDGKPIGGRDEDREQPTTGLHTTTTAPLALSRPHLPTSHHKKNSSLPCNTAAARQDKRFETSKRKKGSTAVRPRPQCTSTWRRTPSSFQGNGPKEASASHHRCVFPIGRRACRKKKAKTKQGSKRHSAMHARPANGDGVV